MNKRNNNYSKYKYKNNFFDIDIDDMMEFIEAGYKLDEIAKELSVSKEQINTLRDEINKNY
ncbi:hypothetical protein [Paramaledivibacter caminithermalis]|jgi:orotate phosphoribosyltransferase-like protein|uniref:Helix-turn-helix domain of resolvase n=1 Tax=Paramaledivibacter caminithermalis (strain DSM 15212 / CIP 107654 / DViRD3) TaxID=1121301 RepID=A0A1M6JWI2_PARC5|nr:hypothetical protein [Paramaledivibacter caminithermalis]SHJ50988.1 hypothetical protein SAMN02745912_00191 [Paramaledivibacter caminithermalis DSM 15212]